MFSSMLDTSREYDTTDVAWSQYANRWNPLVTKWKAAMGSLCGNGNLFFCPPGTISDVNRVMDDEPAKAVSVTVRVVKVPMNANTFVNVCDPLPSFLFAKMNYICCKNVHNLKAIGVVKSNLQMAVFPVQ